jgi:hypothetical protein
MKLEGKFKDDFEKWLINQKYSIYHNGVGRQPNIINLCSLFDILPINMQYGVLVDFCDSVGYVISIEYDLHTDDFVSYINEEPTHLLYHWEERNDAREKAILKAQEIYNGRI